MTGAEQRAKTAFHKLREGGQLLDVGARCFSQKLPCWMTVVGRQKKKAVEDKDGRDLGESSESDVESEGRGKRWLERFSTMKVEPPRHVRATMGSTNPTGKNLRRKREVIGPMGTTRAASLEAKLRLEWFHECVMNYV